jgi:hypothetical protein
MGWNTQNSDIEDGTQLIKNLNRCNIIEMTKDEGTHKSTGGPVYSTNS